MRTRPGLGLAALCTACAGTPPTPPPPVAAPEPPGIETSAVDTLMLPAVPIAPNGAFAPDETFAPADPAPEPALAPTLSRAQIDRTFAHHRRYFNDAYRQHLQARPRLGGTIQVSFTIHPDGTARGARTHSSTLGDAAFERAVLEQIERMSFPPAAGPTVVERYPLQFTEQNKR